MLQSPRLLVCLLGLAMLSVPCSDAVLAQQSTAEEQKAEQQPKPRTRYMGRRIAQTMGFQGAPWLSRKNRNDEENLDLMLEKLDLKPGMSVCDLGCGNGVLTLPMAEAVGEEGVVYAVDIQPEMLDLLSSRAERAGHKNIELILSKPWDAMLPEDKIDLVLIVDVYHEFAYPERMLQSIRKSLSKDGVIALLEYRAEDEDVPIRPLHKMSKKQILKEYAANGFKVVREFDELPWQHMMFLGKTDEPATKSDSTNLNSDADADIEDDRDGSR